MGKNRQSRNYENRSWLRQIKNISRLAKTKSRYQLSVNAKAYENQIHLKALFCFCCFFVFAFVLNLLYLSSSCKLPAAGCQLSLLFLTSAFVFPFLFPLTTFHCTLIFAFVLNLCFCILLLFLLTTDN